MPKYSVQKEDIQKIQDKNIIIVQGGGHSTPSIENMALHDIATNMYKKKKAHE